MPLQGAVSSRKAPPPPLVIAEHGLTARYERGDVVVDHKAADPDNPKARISRPKVRCSYDYLHAKGGLSDEQREAADKYAILREMETGARWRPDGVAGGNRNAWDKHQGLLTQIQVAAKLRSAHEALGKRAQVVVALLVVENMGLEAIGRRLGHDRHVARGLVVAALLRLVDHWGLDRE